jgi:ATP-dependent DNA helicase RecQ
VERIAKQLTRSGVGALAYHAGLDDAHRHEVQEAFMGGATNAIVATNAFGMGIDKPNVRLVVHYTMPGTLEAYYQEAGRAGRDGLPANCVLLHSYQDRFTHEWFIRGMYPERSAVERLYAKLRATHVNGEVAIDRADRDASSALRLMQNHGIVVQQRREMSRVRVRLLATPARIRRELDREKNVIELDVLRSLWRLNSAALQDGFLVDLGGLPPGIAGRPAREALERLRARQFVDFSAPGTGLCLTKPSARIESFGIDWAALTRRRERELAKLDMMQQYAYTKNCRRALVLRYFGERRANTRCSGCDNCSSP